MYFIQIEILIACAFLQHVYSLPTSLSLTFEVENNENFCLYHQFNNTFEYLLSYGVLDGANLDILFSLDIESIDQQQEFRHKQIYTNKITKKDSIHFFGNLNFVHRFCFSNEFSPFSHKLVFMDVKPVDKTHLASLREETDRKKIPIVFTRSDKNLNEMHRHLTSIQNVQYFFRYEESTDRNFAEALSFKVSYMSLVELGLVLVVGLMQVCFVKRLFAPKHKTYIN